MVSKLHSIPHPKSFFFWRVEGSHVDSLLAARRNGAPGEVKKMASVREEIRPAVGCLAARFIELGCRSSPHLRPRLAREERRSQA